MRSTQDGSAGELLLDVRGLRLSGSGADVGPARVMLVDTVSLSVRCGETLALVGESGSGKTLTALAVLGLLPSGVRVEGGSVRFDGRELLGQSPKRMREVRGRGIAMVFQEAASALDPLLPVGRQIRDALRRHGSGGRGKDEVTSRAVELLRTLDFDQPERVLGLRPWELSGGMGQRVLLALALACEPRLLICDEPTRALDAPAAVCLLDLLRRERTPQRAQLLISHDLEAVRRVADRIAVMHAGQIVEILEAAAETDLAEIARHPYTQALLASRPGGEPGRRLAILEGEAPRPGAFPPGCRFAPRCPHVHARCMQETPGWFGATGRLEGPEKGVDHARWRCFGWQDGATALEAHAEGDFDA